MASYETVKTITLLAGESLVGDFAEILTLDTTGRAVKTSGATSRTIGVLAEEPPSATVGQPVAVAVIGGGGIIKMKAGATITAGQVVVPDATAGRVAGVAGLGNLVVDQMGLGTALSAADDGDIFPVLAQVMAAPHVA